MTREEAIDYNKNLRMYMRLSDKNQPYKFLEENYIALEMAIKALEQEPCGDAKEEIWKDIPEFEGVYEASNMDLISRQAIIDGLWTLDVELRPSTMVAILNMIEHLPCVNPDPKIGYWIEDEEQIHVEITYRCSECGCMTLGSERSNYCPDCGCRMKGEDE